MIPWVLDVVAEMDRQDKKWGAQRFNPIEVDMQSRLCLPTEDMAKTFVDSAAARGEAVPWSAILLEEIAEAYFAPTTELMREELIQCAAVIGQWVERIDYLQALQTLGPVHK